MTKVLFDCDRCEGDVVLTTGPGRATEFRMGIVLEIPEAFPTATCSRCGEIYLNSSEAGQLDKLLESTIAIANECRRLVEAIQRKTGYSQKQIEFAAGVTPTYLSHVMGGRKQPSSTLYGLLECLARHPEEAKRRVDHKHWTHVSLPVSEWAIEKAPTVEVASEKWPSYLRPVIPTVAIKTLETQPVSVTIKEALCRQTG
jgi:transcriptional regulator with XRE-family HTH domain